MSVPTPNDRPTDDPPTAATAPAVPAAGDAPPAADGARTLTDPGRSAPPTVSLVNAGRYRVLRPHARGGLGEVFVAHDDELNRAVALKCIQPSHAGEPSSRRRFLAEAELTARLEHPGVVPVHGLVRDPDGQPCYAMRFIEGGTLAEAIGRFHAPASRGISTVWSSANCSSATCRSATRSRTRTAAASSTATSSRTTSCSAASAKPW
jgi:hypothetical protein